MGDRAHDPFATVSLNGTLVPAGEARVSVFDRGFTFGDGVYEVVRAFEGRWLDLDAHCARLRRSLEAIRMPAALADELPRACTALLDGRPLDASIYLQVTRGSAGARTHLPREGTPPTVAAWLSPCESLAALRALPAPPALAALTCDDRRWLDLHIKSVSLLGAILPLLAADESGCSEVIFVRDGHVAEGGSSNVFAVLDGTLVTPPAGSVPMLHGCMRSRILRVAGEAGIPAAERRIGADDLARAEAIATTGSRSIMRLVSRLDGAEVGARAVPHSRRTAAELVAHLWSALLASIDRDAAAVP